MKRVSAILGLLILFAAACKQKQEDVMAGIKKHYAEINDKLKDYTRKEVDDITNPGGGSITGYYRDDEVKKVTAQHFSDTNRVFSEYYFDDGMLIMAIEQNFVYNRSVKYTEEVAKAGGDSIWYDDKKTRLLTSRYYFKKNGLIKWINQDDIDMPVNSGEFINKQSELWAQTVVLLKELKEQ